MPDTPNGFDKPQKRRGKFKAKGRQVDSERLSFVAHILQPHLEGGPLKRDRLIEYLLISSPLHLRGPSSAKVPIIKIPSLLMYLLQREIYFSISLRSVIK